MNALFTVLAAIMLVIGALGIANTTLVSVMDRVSEIGLRRAMGARPVHIWAQFITETAVLGGMGGIVGTTLGMMCIVTASLTQHWTPVIDPIYVLLCPPAGMIIGILAGLYPALRASHIQPVTALAS